MFNVRVSELNFNVSIHSVTDFSVNTVLIKLTFSQQIIKVYLFKAGLDKLRTCVRKQDVEKHRTYEHISSKIEDYIIRYNTTKVIK